MTIATSDYTLKWKRSRNKIIVTAEREGQTIASDELNIQSKKQRDGFASVLSALGCDAENVNAELLEIAKLSAEQSTTSTSNVTAFGEELDASLVHRPERIITAELCAISVPILSTSPDGVHGQWFAYYRTANGRGRVALSPVLTIDGQRIYLEALPPEPTVCDAASWSRTSREAWLAGTTSVDAADLFTRLAKALDHYIEFPPERRHGYLALLSCWIVQSYVYHAWDSVGYLLVNGPASSGKSTIFNVLNRLTFRPMKTDNVSAAAIYRTLNSYGGTLLFDEAERLRDTKSPDIVEINSMLLAGYQRGRGATRLEKIGDGFKTVNYNVYGPKAVACINGVLSALQTRCIEISTQRAAKSSPKPKRSMDETDWQTLRDDLHVLAIDHGDAWLAAAKRRDIGTELNGRDFEVWQPLLGIGAFFEDAGIGDLVGLLTSTATDSIRDTEILRTPEADETILSVLNGALRDGIEVLGKDRHWHRVYQPISAEILQACRERAASLFSSFSPAGIGHRLRAYGIQTVKSGSRREYRNCSDKLREIQERYGIDLDL